MLQHNICLVWELAVFLVTLQQLAGPEPLAAGLTLLGVNVEMFEDVAPHHGLQRGLELAAAAGADETGEGCPPFFSTLDSLKLRMTI